MKRQIKTVTLGAIAATIISFAAPAFAQDSAPPPAAPAEVRHTGRTSGSVAGGGLGVGATAFISGLVGPEVVYDFGVWHLEGILGFASTPTGINGNGDRETRFDFGVGGWYHLHIGESSDFSIGGAFALLNDSPPGPANSATAFEFEPGAQIRAFITPNVALHGGVGFVFAFGDVVNPLGKQIALVGQINSNLGFTYYFR